MPLLDLDKITTGLSKTWDGFLRDWDRSLRAGNYPETTRYNYMLAAAQLARYLAEHATPDLDADDAAEDPTEVTNSHIEAFQGWMIESDDLLERARREDARHWKEYQRPISAETLRKRLHVGAARSRMLVAMIRSDTSSRRADQAQNTAEGPEQWRA